MSTPFDSAATHISYDVVIPVWNGERFVARAIESVRRQAVSPQQIFVIDDGSTDRSAENARIAGATVIKIPHGGVSLARNTGLRAASADWVAFLDCDDIWTTTHIADLSHLDSCGAVLLTSPHRYYNGEIVGNTSGSNAPLTARTVLIDYWGISASGTMVRRDAALEAGGFDETMTHCEDLDFWLRILATSTGVSSGIPSVISDRHDRHASMQVAQMRLGLDAVIKNCRGKPWFDSQTASAAHAILAWDDLHSYAGAPSSSAREIMSALTTLLRRPLTAERAIRPLVRKRRRGRASEGRHHEMLDREQAIGGTGS